MCLIIFFCIILNISMSSILAQIKTLCRFHFATVTLPMTRGKEGGGAFGDRLIYHRIRLLAGRPYDDEAGPILAAEQRKKRSEVTKQFIFQQPHVQETATV